jgi:iron complex outermembrane receptor protein
MGELVMLHRFHWLRDSSRVLFKLLWVSSATLAFATVVKAADGTDATGAASSTALDEVIVTARRTEENAQRVPIVVTAFGEKQLEEKAITAPTELQFHVPSLTLTGAYGNLTGTYAIRGLNNGVTAYFAEVEGGPTNPAAPFFDLANVQVLNGPQGTLFGRANTAGAVIVTPNRPNMDDMSGEARVIAGDYDRNDVLAVANIPIIKGEMALRVAFNRERREGYTNIIGGGGEPLGGNDNDSVRATLDWRPGGGAFINQATYNYYRVNETPLGFVLSDYNPSLGIFNLPANDAAYLAGGGTPASYAGMPAVAAQLTNLTTACNGAVAGGLASNFNSCMDTRLQYLGTLGPALAAELARVNSGHNGVFSTLASTHYPYKEFFTQNFFADKAQYDFGDIGFTTVSAKNIFGYQQRAGGSNYNVDGLGSQLEQSFYTGATLGSYNQSFGTGYINSDTPVMKTYTEEFQLTGVAAKDLLTWTLGGYYQRDPQPRILDGSPNLYRLDNGVFSAGYGWTPAVAFYNGGRTTQKAGYFQGTLNLGYLTPFISGLHLTGGFRRSSDDSVVNFLSALATGPGGMFVPGVGSTTQAKSSGDNTEISLDAQITPTLLLYGSRRTGYRPGGVNNLVGTASLPSFSPTYGPEDVTDYEGGVKYDFTVGDVRGRLNFDVYQDNYSNIQESFRASVGSAIYIYTGNVAQARLRGFEAAYTLLMGNWSIDGVYSYTDARYTNWIGTDPLNLLAPGNAACLPQSTASACLIDLSKSPFINAPKNIASATVRYELPLDAKYGHLAPSLTPSYRSLTYLNNSALRYQQVFGPSVMSSISQPGFLRVDGRFEWLSMFGSNFDTAFWVTNLTNKAYAIAAVTQLQSTNIGDATKGYAPPRMFALSAAYHWK